MERNFTDKPFTPARWPFFYGWAVLGFGTLGLLASAPGQTIGVSTFTDHLIEALGLSRADLSMAYMFGTIGSSLLLAQAGKVYDRFGARVVTPVTCVLLGGVLVGLSQCDRIARGLAAASGLHGATVAFAVMLVGFFALRFTGQGVLAMTSRNMVLKWFERHRGLAVGISGVFVSLGFSMTPRLFDAMIEAWSWRGAWLAAAGGIGVGVAAVAVIFFRDEPEACGLLPDGDAPPEPGDGGGDGPQVHPLRQFTLPEARRCFGFWAFALAIAIFGLFVTGLMFHVESIFREAGMSKAVALSIFLPTSLTSVSVRLIAGWISDHIRLKYLLIVQLLGLACGMVGFIYLSAGWTRWLIVAGDGVCVAMVGLLSGVVWPRFFGRKHLGAISGMAMSLTVFASAIGPFLFAQSLRWTGSYRPAGWTCLAVVAPLLIAAWWANNPQHKKPDTPQDERAG